MSGESFFTKSYKKTSGCQPGLVIHPWLTQVKEGQVGGLTANLCHDYAINLSGGVFYL
jgi:hypothetical protein